MAYLKSPIATDVGKRQKEDIQAVQDFIKNTKLSDLIKTTESYRGKDVRFDLGKVGSVLMKALNAIDPAGIGAGPGGFVFSPGTALWNPQKISQLKQVGTLLERDFPRLKAATELTPVKTMQPLITRPSSIAEYVSQSPQRPYGTIYGYQESKNPWTWLPHEGLHRLYGSSPETQELARELWLRSPTGTEDIMTAYNLATPHTKQTEYFAYTLENLLRNYYEQPQARLFKNWFSPTTEMSLMDFLTKVK